MRLKVTMKEPVGGYWDGGKKSEFFFEIEPFPFQEGFTKIGSWAANHFFHVKTGKTEKLTLSYAKKHLWASMNVKPLSIEYVEDN